MPVPNFFDSYPPLFRPADGVVVEEPKNTPCCDLESDPIPVIDLESLNHPEGKQKLIEACKEWGIFRLVNNGIPITLLDQLHDISKELFSLPFDTKVIPGAFSPLDYFYGISVRNNAGAPLQVEGGPNPQKADYNWLEGFDARMKKLSTPAKDPKLDTYRIAVEEFAEHQMRLARSLFKVVVEDLKLDEEKAKSYISPSTGDLRLYRYPRCYMPNRDWAINTHTDSAIFSILTHYGVGGFQVLKDDKWLDVKPIRSSMVVVLGDLLEAMSNDTYKSATHMVKASKEMERLSIGYFVFPNDDAVITSPNYKPFTLTDFRNQVLHDMSTIGVKRALQHLRLKKEEST